jgi:hypothetical protein
MLEEATFFDILRIVMLWVSPLIVIVGVLLLVLNRGEYGSLEDKLGREIGGIKKRVIPQIETNIDSLQEWMLDRKSIVGLVFIVCFLLIFFSLR